VHDVKLLKQTLDGIVIDRPMPDEKNLQHLCADAGYMGKNSLASIISRWYQPHIRLRKEEAERKQREPRL